MNILKKINHAKEKILRFIHSEQAKNGFPPTVREISSAVGLTSPASVHRYLKELIAEGSISYEPNKKRSYSVASDKSKPDAIPLLGKVAAGLPISALENREDEFPVPPLLLHRSDSDAFMLRVSGESMRDAGIHDNDIIVIEQDIVPNDGDIVVARIDGEDVTVKRFYLLSEKEIELRPENEAFEIMRFATDRVEIIGRVTGLMRSY